MQVSTHRCLWSSLERLGLWESYLERDVVSASASGGLFGLRWDPQNDILKVPEKPGVFVLFFKKEWKQVGSSGNLFRTLVQHYHAPSMQIQAFSWRIVEEETLRTDWLARMQAADFATLWSSSLS